MNLFKTELWSKYITSPGSSYGKLTLTTRNGDVCYVCSPGPFYNGNLSPKSSSVLLDELDPTKVYELDMWIDTDDVSSGGSNRPGGFYFYGGGTVNCTITGSKTSPMGWQRVHKLLPLGTSYLNVYYYTSTNFYIRADSYLVEVLNPLKITKTGVLELSQLCQNNSEIAQIHSGGSAHCNHFYEY